MGSTKKKRIYNLNNANIYKIVLKGLLNFAKYYYTRAFPTQLIKAYNDAIETKNPKNQSELAEMS